MDQRDSRTKTPRLVLASGSPRRRDLLNRAGYDFEVVLPGIDEIDGEGRLTIRETTAFNAMRKALAISGDLPDAVVLGADTLVALSGQVIGKPADLDAAARVLRQLGGRTHEVWTSVFICQASIGKVESFQEISRVRFRELDQKRIANYLRKIDPLDKAGVYAAQGCGAEIIEQIEGSYTNVVGLPMEETARVLRVFGVSSRQALKS